MSTSSEDQDVFRRELGTRIATIVSRFPTKAAAAEAAGISVEQLNKWIRGDVKVATDGLKSLSDAVNADLSWLVTGDAVKTAAGSGFIAAVDFSIIGSKVGDLVVKTYRAHNVRLPDTALAQEIVRRISQLYQKAEDPKDMEELFSLLPWLENQIIKTMDDAAAEPGNGKHSAS